jgi:hypothetical protein
VTTPAVSKGTRAKGKVRRYCRSNGLAFLWTLTYRVAVTTRARVVADVRLFYRQLQRLYGRMPLVSVIERGRRGTRRLHVHFATDRWLSHELVEAAWHRGFVWVGDPGKLQGNPGVDRLSKYLAKYVAKEYGENGDLADDRAQGEHRYLVTQGWCPPEWRRRFPRAAAALAWLLSAYGTPDAIVAFGEDSPQEVHGYWCHFRAGDLWPPPNPT